MERWSNRTEAGGEQRAMSPIRIKPGKPLNSLILSEDVVAAWTHYDGGRSRICLGAECQVCARNLAARWYGYLCIYSTASNKKGLLEITPRCAEALTAWHEVHRTLRGARISVWRDGPRINSQLSCSVAEGGFSGTALPPPFDVRETLRRLWGLINKPEGQRRLLEAGIVEPVLSQASISEELRRKVTDGVGDDVKAAPKVRVNGHATPRKRV